MTDFLNRHTLHLTPLSPIHLGTGEDFEPTNYVIYDNALYAFDPARAELDDRQRQELLKTVRRINAKNDMEGLAQIKCHIQTNAKHFIRGAYSISSTTNKLAEEYQETKDNQFRIERTATNPHSHAPYIPGSALKGCLRTALMEIRSEKQPPETYHLNNPLKEKREQQLYGDALLEQYPHNPRRPEFSSDQLRLTKPSDLTANYDIFTHICYAVNRKKERAREKETLYGRRETIPHGQYRAFSGSLAQYDLTEDNRRHAKKPLAEQYPAFAELIRAANHYHLTRFAQESALLIERGLVQPEWQRSTERLLEALKPELDSGTILLVRLGKNGGAESKTLEKYAQIKIMSAKGAKPTYEKHTKTVWLAAENDKTKRDLLPFGWALIEIDPTDDNPALREWCDKNSAHLKDAAVLRDKLHAAQNAKAEQAAKNAAEAAAKAAAAAAKQAEEEAEAARVAALPTHERLAHDILARLEEHSKTYSDRNQDKNLALHRDILAILEQAHSELDSTRQKQLAELLPYKKLDSACKGFYSGKKEKDIKAALQKLRGG
ncbi:type III-A CRISPR-associated RAMP protein Csm5 [Cardiobacterium hominis]|uniref:type III-A CRISPR-associated RAMP protein Csm5 n=1 Tax=Cardiobacterium hominis TaxID=2718 RepID=UPI0028D25C7A|nr:type III-A CRISPR-associated RAMP protein Csm5 [Cardiobacterium hominis]